ncbi:hypothetical protein TeGR_g3331 [Tetraparma gracilis]|uniref:THH1/TOM1/TOM3 domain-containing protein n=1 Tax=Tetraparma gracilis TaxID=2962635 RepID=A0ABQ6N7Z2_9STRA|nr:hypothetical protein TeGR_g3331 [Tetraparma gracilis]
MFADSQWALCNLNNATGSIVTSGGSSTSCSSTCQPLSVSCDALSRTATLEYSEEVVCFGDDTPVNSACFLFVYPAVGLSYAILYAIVFFVLFCISAREIWIFATELPPNQAAHLKATGRTSKHKNADSDTIIRKRATTVSFNRPASKRANMISGLFQPSRVRVSVQACCCAGTFLRFWYLALHASDTCPEGSACSALLFEPANVMFISAALLTVMFWKKMGMMFKKGISRANQSDEDMRFFQIFGFYFVFQMTMVVVQLICAANRIHVTALYDISLVVSGMYMLALLVGSVKFGIMLVAMITGGNPLQMSKAKADGARGGIATADDKKKTWKKIRKVVMMLMFVVPAAAGYVLSLAVYIGAGMRYDVAQWMPMQFVFRTLEVVIATGFIICLSHKAAPAKPIGDTTRASNMSTASAMEPPRPPSGGIGAKARAETYTPTIDEEEGDEEEGSAGAEDEGLRTAAIV